MNNTTQCPNCKAELKSGLMSSNKLLSEGKTKIINEYHEPKAEGYCSNAERNFI